MAGGVGLDGGGGGSGRQPGVDFQVGDRSERPPYPVRGRLFLKLYRRLPEAECYRSDYYQVYEWLPQDRHVAGKGGEVNWNEELHSRFRDRLKRLGHKTKGYTKKVGMLRDSIALVCLQMGLFY